MSAQGKKSGDGRELPKAVVKTGGRFSVVWIVPLVAAVVAGVWLYDALLRSGPTIQIRFKDGSGLRTDQTFIKYRGISVGEVSSIFLSQDYDHVVVKARLYKSGAKMAREGSLFWIVRPEISAGNIRGLGTIMSGAYIQMEPGRGPEQRQFVGLEQPRISVEKGGLSIILLSPRIGSIKAGSSVLYRGVEVGTVERSRLADDARAVEIRAHISPPYAPLVRTDSVFWNAGGLDVDFGLFRGADIRAESLSALVSGAVAFATPTKPGELATNGLIFRLHDKPQDEWLDWMPAIEIKDEESPMKPDKERGSSLPLGNDKKSGPTADK